MQALVLSVCSVPGLCDRCRRSRTGLLLSKSGCGLASNRKSRWGLHDRKSRLRLRRRMCHFAMWMLCWGGRIGRSCFLFVVRACLRRTRFPVGLARPHRHASRRIRARRCTWRHHPGKIHPRLRIPSSSALSSEGQPEAVLERFHPTARVLSASCCRASRSHLFSQ